jgi:uncharacterized protein with HEPN domain
MQQYALMAFDIAQRTTREDLVDPMNRLALERTLEIVGEAASQLPLEFRQSHGEVPWRLIIGMRNILAHGYASVDLDILWRTVTQRIPGLLGQLETLIEEAEADSPPET